MFAKLLSSVVLIVLLSVYSAASDIYQLKPVSGASVTPELMSGDLASSVSTVTEFNCNYANVDDSDNILYGSRSWSFPEQDTNLTLTYPTQESDLHSSIDYIITAFRVILYSDGVRSSGYIVDGTVFGDKISLLFLSRGITKLAYEFWLFGTPKSSDAFNSSRISIEKGCYVYYDVDDHLHYIV